MTSVDDLSDAHNAFVENLLRGLFLEGEDTAGNHLRFVEISRMYAAMRHIRCLIRT